MPGIRLLSPWQQWLEATAKDVVDGIFFLVVRVTKVSRTITVQSTLKYLTLSIPQRSHWARGSKLNTFEWCSLGWFFFLGKAGNWPGNSISLTHQHNPLWALVRWCVNSPTVCIFTCFISHLHHSPCLINYLSLCHPELSRERQDQFQMYNVESYVL